VTYPPQSPGQGPYDPRYNMPAEPPGRTRRQKVTFGTALGVAASIATILTLFLTLGQQPSQQQSTVPKNADTGTAATPVNIYPASVQTNFLNSCEANGSAWICQCSLSWFEQHVGINQFNQDEIEVDQGNVPADITSVEQACG
jgi:hypothetical protein